MAGDLGLFWWGYCGICKREVTGVYRDSHKEC